MSLYAVKTDVDNDSTARTAQRKLARKSNGQLWCVYHRTIGGIEKVCVAYSDDNGETWIEELGDKTWQEPSIAIDSNDNVHIAYRSGHIYYRKRTTSWGDEEQVSVAEGTNQSAPSIGIDANDNIHIAWEGLGWGSAPDFGNVQYRKRTSEGWQNQEAVTDNNQHNHNVSLAVDIDGNVHLVWYGKGWGPYPSHYSIQYRMRTISWQSQQTVDWNKNYDQTNPQIAIDDAGNVHVIWDGMGHGTNPDFENIQYRKRTTIWQTKEAVTDVAYDQWNPTISLDADGDIYATWRGKGWGSNITKYNIGHCKRTTSWGDVISITDAAYDQNYPINLFTLHPIVNGLRTHVPTIGYALVFTGQNTGGYNVMFFASTDLVWPSSAAAYYHGLKVQGVGELALCDVGTNPLRMRKGGTTYGLELVAIDDPNASRIRIKTSAGIKAIRKYT